MSLISYDQKARHIERAKKNKAGKSFILSISGLIPRDAEDKEDLKKLGFKSLTEFIKTSKGLVLDSETFVKLAFAYWSYRHQACKVINYLVSEEKWHELLGHVPADYQVECGARLNDNGMRKEQTSFDNIKAEGGTSASYTLKRLARDAENDPEVAEVYNQVKKGSISPNRAAIDLGWRVPTITVRKDPRSAARSLKKLFNDQEIRELIKELG